MYSECFKIKLDQDSRNRSMYLRTTEPSAGKYQTTLTEIYLEP